MCVNGMGHLVVRVRIQDRVVRVRGHYDQTCVSSVGMLTRVRKRCECLADASCLLWVLVLVMWVRSCVSKATAHGRALSPSPYPVGDALRGTRSVFNTDHPRSVIPASKMNADTMVKSRRRVTLAEDLVTP